MAQSSYKEGTYNPFWSEAVHMENINMQDLIMTNITKGLVVEAFDHVNGGSKDQFIGSFLIKLNTKNLIKYKPSEKDLKASERSKPVPMDFIYIKPKWYYVTNPHI